MTPADSDWQARLAVALAWKPPEGLDFRVIVSPGGPAVVVRIFACCVVTDVDVRGAGAPGELHAFLDAEAADLIARRDARHAARDAEAAAAAPRDADLAWFGAWFETWIDDYRSLITPTRD